MERGPHPVFRRPRGKTARALRWLGGVMVVVALLCASFIAFRTTTPVSANGSVTTAPQYAPCSTTRWVEEQATDDYQQDGNGTYHLQNQLWVQIDARYPDEYCGSERAVAQLWVPSGGSISDWCVALTGSMSSGNNATGNCWENSLSGGGPYVLQTSPLSLRCGYAGGGGSNNSDPRVLATTTGTYPC